MSFCLYMHRHRQFKLLLNQESYLSSPLLCVAIWRKQITASSRKHGWILGFAFPSNCVQWLVGHSDCSKKKKKKTLKHVSVFILFSLGCQNCSFLLICTKNFQFLGMFLEKTDFVLFNRHLCQLCREVTWLIVLTTSTFGSLQNGGLSLRSWSAWRLSWSRTEQQVWTWDLLDEVWRHGS